MSDLHKTDRLEKSLKQRMKPLQVRAVSLLMAQFFRHVMAYCPVEDGHAHEAFLTAMTELSGELSGQEFNAVVREFIKHRSGDPSASAGGSANVGEDGETFVANVKISLPFVRKLEYGGLIRVGDMKGNRGPKVSPVSRPPDKGPLYGARHSKGVISGTVLSGRSKLSASEASQIRKGVGLLVWEENGVVHREITRRPRAYGFWRIGLNAVRVRARQMKLKKV